MATYNIIYHQFNDGDLYQQTWKFEKSHSNTSPAGPSNLPVAIKKRRRCEPALPTTISSRKLQEVVEKERNTLGLHGGQLTCYHLILSAGVTSPRVYPHSKVNWRRGRSGHGG